MRAVITFLFLILPFAAVSAAPMYVMSAEVWMRPRQGADLLADERLRELVLGLDEQSGSRLLIHYPGGEAGGMWAHELRSWLIALGVPGARIELAPGGVREAALGVELLTGRGAESMEPSQ
ncbi:hypothetical protein [Thiohalobacter thiocyanaticus]|nr:hypothetical protein [Thiohalobacter thiocyanaticus]